jgi:tetratricopeptide (TPR) repeat protein
MSTGPSRKNTEAIQLLEPVRGALEKKLGPDHPNTLAVVNALASAYLNAKRPLEAIQLLEPVYERVVIMLGPNHTFSWATLNNLASAYVDGGKPRKAIPLLQRVYEATEKQLGPNHPPTMFALNNLATAYYRVQQFDKSIELFKKVIERREARLGPLNLYTLGSLLSLGNIYFDAGRVDEAIQALEKVYPHSKSHRMLETAGGDLARAYLKAGRKTDAARVMQEQIEDARKSCPPDSPDLAYRLSLHGDQMLQMKQFAEAEPVLRECLALREKLAKHPVKGAEGAAAFNSMQVVVMKSLLGAALLGQEKHAEAEPLLLASYAAYAEKLESLRPMAKKQLAETIQRLVQLYDATGQKEKAAEWRRNLATLEAPDSAEKSKDK